MQRILISACLLGDKVRYDGKNSLHKHPALQAWQKECRLVKLCPEVAGGLSVPRNPAEIQGVSGGIGVLKHQAKIITNHNHDVTKAYLKGAKKALSLAKKHQIKIAILKSRSPSCGNHQIYDGTYTKTLINGMGTTAALLKQNGIAVFNENEIDEAAQMVCT